LASYFQAVHLLDGPDSGGEKRNDLTLLALIYWFLRANLRNRERLGRLPIS
jgi:hypothetical protein